ncbi:MAG: hypothetical protein ABEN55_08825, partial [Bradymonadaceae bacterium]
VDEEIDRADAASAASAQLELTLDESPDREGDRTDLVRTPEQTGDGGPPSEPPAPAEYVPSPSDPKLLPAPENQTEADPAASADRAASAERETESPSGGVKKPESFADSSAANGGARGSTAPEANTAPPPDEPNTPEPSEHTDKSAPSGRANESEASAGRSGPDPTGSVWTETIRPLVTEHWLLLVGAFLVVASGAYLLSVVWQGLSTFARLGFSYGLLVGLSVGFSELGHFLERRQQLTAVRRTLWAVAVGFIGIAAPVAGFVLTDRLLVGLFGVVVTPAVGFVLTTIRHPDEGAQRFPPTAFATVGLLASLSLAALGDEVTATWMVAPLYFGALFPLLTVHTSRPSAADDAETPPRSFVERLFGEPVSLEGAGATFSHLGPPIFLFTLLVGVVGTRLTSAGMLADIWPWAGGVVGLVGLMSQEFGRRHTRSQLFWDLLAAGLAIVGIVVGFGHPPALVAAGLMAVTVLWRLQRTTALQFVVGYAVAGITYWAGVQLAGSLVGGVGPTGSGSGTFESLLYLPFLVLVAIRQWQGPTDGPESTVNAAVSLVAAWGLVGWSLLSLGESVLPLLVAGGAAVLVQALYLSLRRAKRYGYAAAGLALVWVAGTAATVPPAGGMYGLPVAAIAGLGAVHGFLPCPILYPGFLYAFARADP